MNLPFTKVEGLGNDFVLVDWRGRAYTPAELQGLATIAPRVCDRRRGVGADGILVVTDHPQARAQMIVINHDGSRPEMCGNGLRCVASFVATKPESFDVQTDAGRLRCLVHIHQDQKIHESQVEIDMGLASSHGIHTLDRCPGFQFHSVSIGNPHAITFVTDSDLTALARRHGPIVECDPLFPDRTNVEFARVTSVDGRPEIELAVWERGCGLTQACGTGACATAFAAVQARHLAPDCDVRVHLPGGTLVIRVPSDAQGVRMTGPARQVFAGTFV